MNTKEEERYINLLTNDKVTKIKELIISNRRKKDSLSTVYVLYKKDNPQVVEWTNGPKHKNEYIYEFTKPKYVFEQSYKKI